MPNARVLLFAALAFTSFDANATFITVDPSLYADGTDLSHIVPGLTLSSMSVDTFRREEPTDVLPPAQYLPIIVVDSLKDPSKNMFGHPDNGIWDNSFANEGPAARFLGNELGLVNAFNVFRADFASGTNYAQLLVRGCCGDLPRVDFWGLDGALIGTCSTPAASAVNGEGCSVVNVGNPSNTFPDYQEPFLMSWTSSTANIGFVTFGGWMGGGEVHQISYNDLYTAVPEPGPLALFAVGVFGLGVMRSRGTRRVSKSTS